MVSHAKSLMKRGSIRASPMLESPQINVKLIIR